MQKRRTRILLIASASALLVALVALDLGGWQAKTERVLGRALGEDFVSSALSVGFASERIVPHPGRNQGPTVELRLRDADPVSRVADSVAVDPGTPLDPDRTAELLDQLPPLASAPEDRSPFEVRGATKPPQLAGDEVAMPFPPPKLVAPEPIRTEGPLRVTRHAPEGAVPMAATLSISFSEPMIAVGSTEDALQQSVVQLSPQPPGRWRWLGTQTLVFEPTVRFPAATKYGVVVPEGKKAASGNALEVEVAFGFETPPVKLVHNLPIGSAVDLSPVIFLSFDQRVDQDAILDFIRLEGREKRKLRIATQEEIEADARIASLVDEAEPGRWIAVTPMSPLEPGREFDVVLARGAPSAEGPRTTEQDQRFEFSTYDELAIEDYSCDEERTCRPSGHWWIRFNNPLDEEQELDIVIEPELSDQAIEIHDRMISIVGRMSAKTRYRIVVPASLRDRFEQTLGKDTAIEITTGPAPRQLYGHHERIVTIDPFGPAVLPIHSTNNRELSIRINRVQPEDWHAFNRWSQVRFREHGFEGGEVVHDSWVEVADEDELTTLDIDLRPHLEGGFGHFVVWVEPADRLAARQLLHDPPASDRVRGRQGNGRRWTRLPGSELVYWVQVTKLGLTALSDGESVVSWVTSLEDGSPVADAIVDFAPSIVEPAITNADGLARQPANGAADRDPALFARKGHDSVLLGNYQQQYQQWKAGSKPLLWYQFTDRGVYRPGEEINLKGWLRSVDARHTSSPSIPKDSIERINWTFQGSRGDIIAEGSAGVSALGGFAFEVPTPDEMNLGHALFSLTAVRGDEPIEEWRAHHQVMIQEFRRPEFEVSSHFETSEYMLGDTAVVDVSAKYFAGGGLSAAPVSWDVVAEFGSYTPPHHDDFSFGPWTPWWGGHSFYEPELVRHSHQAKTDAAGKHRLAIELVSFEEPRPIVVHASASVQDRNRQSWTGHGQTLVHPAELYVGLRADRTFVESGEGFEVETVVVDTGGERVPGVGVELRVEEAPGFFRQTSTEKDAPKVVAECSIASRDVPSSCRFEIDRGGSYRVVAEIEDATGRKNESELQFWIAGESTSVERTLDREHVQLIPDRKEYQPGDVAEILVQAPFFPAEGLVILGRNRILETKAFELTASTHTLQIPITEAHLSGLNVAVELVGQSEPSGERPRVAFAGGELELAVPPRIRGLDVRATAAHEALAPGDETEIEIRVADAEGVAIEGAEVALVVVDESVLALTGYTLGDPLDVFYPKPWRGYWAHHQRSQVALSESNRGDEEMVEFSSSDLMRLGAQPTRLKALGYAVEEGGLAADAAAPPTPNLRTDFSPLALFAPAITTDEEGRAIVPLELPDSLTRYRIMAVAVSGDRLFGKGESQVTARLPLMVRPSPPRFLNFGDRVELPVLLQNQTDDDFEVEVAVRGTNAILGAKDSGIRSAGSSVRVPANDRVEVRFEASTESAGTARFQVVAASTTASDAASFDFPVWTPATREATATYGVIDDGAIAQPISTPASAWPQFGGLEITTSSTQLQALTDAMLYLNTYEFECSEQIASRMLSIVALRDVLEAFDVAGMPSRSELEARIDEDIATLATLQNPDGGFGFWYRGEESWPYLTIHVAHALTRARAKGYATEFAGWKKLNDYISNIDRYILPETSARTANALRAYALYVRSLNDDVDRKRARKLARSEELSIESIGWLLPLLETGAPDEHFDAALRRLTNNVTETAAGAHFVTSYTDGAHVLLHSARRADGVVLGALVATDAHNDLVPKLVRGLLDHRKRGRWMNTQENVFILLALSDYFAAFESTTPDFLARFWLGDGFAGEHPFKGRSTDRVQLDVPMSQLLELQSPTPLTIQKRGEGRLYYRVGMRYAPKSLETEAMDFGFTVTREYEAVDDPDDVYQDDEGNVHIKAGARVRVTVSMVSPMRRYHVALVDPLPAGLEPINSALATSERLPADERERKPGWWWYGHWYDHENLRDERVEAFTSLLREGVHTYRYFARATTPGEFVAPPARAEEMYHPETFGRSASQRVVVE